MSLMYDDRPYFAPPSPLTSTSPPSPFICFSPAPFGALDTPSSLDDFQQHSSSPTLSSATDTPPPIVAATVVPDDNAIKRVHRHRQLDSRRRQREKAAVARLNELTLPTEKTSRRRGRKTAYIGRDRPSILEAAVAIIEKQRQQLQVAADTAAALRSTKREAPQTDRVALADTDADALSEAVTTKKRRRTDDDAECDGELGSVTTHERLYSSMFHHAECMQVLINADTGVCLSVNKAFTMITGLLPRECIGKQVTPTRREWLTLELEDIPEMDDSIPRMMARRGRVSPCRPPNAPHPNSHMKHMWDLHRGNVEVLNHAYTGKHESGRDVFCRMIVYLSKVAAPQPNPQRRYITLVHRIGYMSFI